MMNDVLHTFHFLLKILKIFLVSLLLLPLLNIPIEFLIALLLLSGWQMQIWIIHYFFFVNEFWILNFAWNDSVGTFLDLHVMKMEKIIHQWNIHARLLWNLCFCLLHSFSFFFRIPGLNYRSLSIVVCECYKISLAHFWFLRKGEGDEETIRQNLWLNVKPTTLFIAVLNVVSL